MYCKQIDCVSQFTGMFCESCPFFERTVENIKSVRAAQKYQIKRDLEEIEKEQKMRTYYQAETDKVWNEHCKKEKEKQKEADEYAEYLRLKEKFEGV